MRGFPTCSLEIFQCLGATSIPPQERPLQNTIWWIEETGADGLRLDTFPYVGRPFWHEFHAQLLQLYPHLSTVGEVFNGTFAMPAGLNSFLAFRAERAPSAPARRCHNVCSRSTKGICRRPQGNEWFQLHRDAYRVVVATIGVPRRHLRSRLLRRRRLKKNAASLDGCRKAESSGPWAQASL